MNFKPWLTAALIFASVSLCNGAGGMLLFSRNGSSYVQLAGYRSISHPSGHITYITSNSGERTQVMTAGIIAEIPYPPSPGIDANAMVAQLEMLSAAYPKYTKYLSGAKTVWEKQQIVDAAQEKLEVERRAKLLAAEQDAEKQRVAEQELAAEQTRLAEEKRIAEEKRAEEDKQRLATETLLTEQNRIEANARITEKKRIEEKKEALEQKRIAAAKKSQRTEEERQTRALALSKKTSEQGQSSQDAALQEALSMSDLSQAVDALGEILIQKAKAGDQEGRQLLLQHITEVAFRMPEDERIQALKKLAQRTTFEAERKGNTASHEITSHQLQSRQTSDPGSYDPQSEFAAIIEGLRRTAASGEAESKRDAMQQLGNIYRVGWHTHARVGIATYWYREAANIGDLKSMCSLFEISLKNPKIVSEEEGRNWLHHAAKSGSETALAIVAKMNADISPEERLKNIAAIYAQSEAEFARNNPAYAAGRTVRKILDGVPVTNGEIVESGLQLALAIFEQHFSQIENTREISAYSGPPQIDAGSMPVIRNNSPYSTDYSDPNIIKPSTYQFYSELQAGQRIVPPDMRRSTWTHSKLETRTSTRENRGNSLTTVPFVQESLTRDNRGNTWTTMPFGQGSLARDNRGNSLTTLPFGQGSLARDNRGNSLTTMPFGQGSLARDNRGNTQTTMPFGQGSLTRDNRGNTLTTMPFGQGSLTRDNRGNTWTTMPFGKGTVTREQN